ncbi:PAS domain S-box protein [Blastopirellula marina]|uniref:Sensor protein FixL n=1 Tax=Blastopirellula marina TaxID=124 RepID=A0A2S8G9E8_9BACT|nr:PAS domain S-box protein [Blastopirellula marina]PQO40724.1 hypothetical protein C5Y98_05765 [Blastopirellula marina]PTL45684.1 PAS domain S-box protein [Blastopirellula marina]
MFIPSKHEPSTIDQPPPTVLIIDDDPLARGNIRNVLAADGYSILEVETLDDALTQGECLDVAAILLDPKSDSENLQLWLNQLRQRAPHAFVVFLTDAPALSKVVPAVQKGVFDSLLKPIDPTALRACLKRISHLSVIQRSLSAEAHARQRAEVQNHLLADAVSQMGDCVIVTDCDLDHPGPHIVFVNEAACQTTGYSQAELLGQSPRILQGKSTDRALMKQLRQALSAGSSFRCQLVNYRKDGTTYDAELFITPVVDSDNRRTHFVSVHRDITQLNETLQALREGEEQLRAILNTAIDAIITIDYQGTIVGANPATYRMFGYREDELVGQNVKLLMPEPYHSDHDASLERYLRTGHARIIGVGREVVGKRKDGTTFPLSLAISQIDRPPLFTGILRDISALKALQTQVLEIAAEEDRRIGQELHDSVQQELTGLGLLAQTVSEMLSTDIPWATECEPQVAKIRKMIDRVAKGIGETGRKVHQLSRGLVPVEIDAEGLRSALTELAATVEERYNIECRFTSRGDIDLTNNFAATHLFRIVQEAVNNAIKHGGASRIDISMIGREKSILLEVLDDGSGISDKPSSGSGLGLRIMAYRAGLIGASVQVSGGTSGGTLVRSIISRGNIDHV